MIEEIEVIVRIEEKYRNAFIDAICTDYFKAGIDVGIPVIDYDFVNAFRDPSQDVGRVESLCVHLVKNQGFYFTAKMKILDTSNGRTFSSIITGESYGILPDPVIWKERVRITPIMTVANKDPFVIHRIIGFFLYFAESDDERSYSNESISEESQD